MLTHEILPALHDGVHIYRQLGSGQYRVYRVITQLRSDTAAESPSAFDLHIAVVEVTRLTDAALSGFSVEQLFYVSFFSHTHCLCVVDLCGTEILSDGNAFFSYDVQVLQRPGSLRVDECYTTSQADVKNRTRFRTEADVILVTEPCLRSGPPPR